MRLILIKPLLLAGVAYPEGKSFITDEQHGRQLKDRGYAEDDDGTDDPVVDLTEQQSGTAPLTTEGLSGPPKAFDPKQLGHGHWIVVNADGQQVGEFSGNKAAAIAEVERLTAESAPQV